MSLTATRLIELAEELADTPTLSVYVSTETARRRGATHGAWRADVVALTQTLRDRLIDSVARGDREVFDRNFRRLELRLRGLPHAMRAAGWFIARTVAEHRTGDHTFFVGEVQSVEEGSAADSLTYVHRSYKRV